MAKIISMSLNDSILGDLDRVQEEMGFSGRSEAIRAGIRSLLSEQKDLSKLRGTVDAIFVVIHDDAKSNAVSDLRHKHQSLIKTQLHNHIHAHKCLELFIVKGDAAKVQDMAHDFQSNSAIDLAKVITV